MATAHINIGSNLGDRAALLGRAVAAVSARFNVTAVSAVHESEPWGYGSSNRFLNVGVNLDVDDGMDPCSLLETLIGIQNSIDASSHRKSDGTYSDRAIDIDLICFGAMTVRADTPEALAIPHPRMHLRRFVLEPMCEILPGWRHPLTGLTPREMLGRLSSLE